MTLVDKELTCCYFSENIFCVSFEDEFDSPWRQNKIKGHDILCAI